MANGTLVTFYSYKGGVGRTFTVANVAVALAGWGYRVLCIDWDLDAPGLSHYLISGRPERGLVELVGRLRDGHEANWREFVTPVSLQGRTNLDLITAGYADEGYVDRVQEVDWSLLYEEAGLANLLETWREEWKSEYDFVLIDSRTGITDIGAICTAHLPDILVALFSASRQSVDGCMEVVHRAQATRKRLPFDRPALLVLPVPSRFDGREEYKRAQEWRENFASSVSECYDAWAERGCAPLDLIGRTTVPYVAYWSFGEGLPMLDEQIRTTDSIRFFLETIAALLAHRLGDSTLLIQNAEDYIAAAARAGHRSLGFEFDLYLDATPDLSSKANELRQILRHVGIQVFESSSESSNIGSDERMLHALDRCRHAAFLLGKEISPEVEGGLRSFARQTLDEDLGRTLLPIVFPGGYTRTLPKLLQRLEIRVEESVSTDQLAKQIIKELFSKVDPSSEPAKFSQEVIYALVRVGHADPLTRRASMLALGREGDSRVLETLIQGLMDSNAGVRSQAGIAIQSLLADGRVTEVDLHAMASQHIHSEQLYLQIWSAEQLSSLGDKRALYPLLSLISDGNYDIRARAALALGQLKDPEAIDWLEAKLDDEYSPVRYAAERSLARIGNATAIRILLDRLSTAGTNSEVQFIEKLLEQCDLRRLFIEAIHVGDRAQEAVERVFKNVDTNRSLRILEKVLRDEDIRGKNWALYLLGEIGGELAFGLIKSVLRDENPSIRAFALGQASKFIGDDTTRRLVSRDRDGRSPWLDPLIPIDEDRVQQIALRFNWEIEDVRIEYEEINQKLDGNLSLGWYTDEIRISDD